MTNTKTNNWPSFQTKVLHLQKIKYGGQAKGKKSIRKWKINAMKQKYQFMSNLKKHFFSVLRTFQVFWRWRKSDSGSLQARMSFYCSCSFITVWWYKYLAHMDLYKTSQTKNFLSSALSEGRWSAGLKPYITFKCLQIFKDLFFPNRSVFIWFGWNKINNL